MTNKQINIAIAEACGWHDCSFISGECSGLRKDITSLNGRYEPIPDYCNDLNAIHEAEGILTHEQIEVYCSLLQKPQWGIWWAISAPARQRAEAFLRTIDKWEEQNEQKQI